MGFIIGQYINPIIRNSMHPLKGNLYVIEHVLKLFIALQILCFGDRKFYKDWWNAKSVDEYWWLWNMPIHCWLIRHVYFPCLRLGLHKQLAILVVFVISGIFHEICIVVLCHMLQGWAFLGIMFQVLLVLVTNVLQCKFQSSMVGNMIFWFFFCIVGQPMCVLLYYHDVVNRQQLQLAGRSK
ncbi:hypothetical protein SELMODRAFT_404425 [Selaginella moellendorffii]|uniref:diacylglycerol O-acyltransferase n=1 Tax=Selaginella moellendorffii TaxID=88036 RepID=D8QVA4_SELML|nr:hypothetical protein SELMODRAFT_404425 [Selaginella moellendorffii]